MKSLLPRIILLLLCLVPVAFSQDIPGPAGVRQHDGFFLRLVPGGGSSEFSMDVVDVVSFSGGFTATNSIQIGGAVAENLIIYGESGGAMMVSPTVEVSDQEVSDPGSAWVYFGGFGPGITYYFMPANVYISGTILASVAAMSVQGDVEGSKMGFGYHFIAGKEWWTGEQWGLGVAAYFWYGTHENDDDFSVTMSGSSFGILFSATFN